MAFFCTLLTLFSLFFHSYLTAVKWSHFSRHSAIIEIGFFFVKRITSSPYLKAKPCQHKTNNVYGKTAQVTREVRVCTVQKANSISHRDLAIAYPWYTTAMDLTKTAATRLLKQRLPMMTLTVLFIKDSFSRMEMTTIMFKTMPAKAKDISMKTNQAPKDELSLNRICLWSSFSHIVDTLNVSLTLSRFVSLILGSISSVM